MKKVGILATARSRWCKRICVEPSLREYLAALAPITAAAQSASGPLVRDKQAETLPRLADPALVSPTSSTKPQFTLTSSTEDSQAKAEVGFSLADTLRAAIRLEAPVRKGQETEFADLNGLHGGAVGSVGFTKSFLAIHDSGVQGTCDAYNATLRRRDPINLDARECTLETLASRGPEWAFQRMKPAERAWRLCVRRTTLPERGSRS